MVFGDDWVSADDVEGKEKKKRKEKKTKKGAPHAELGIPTGQTALELVDPSLSMY